MFYLYLLEIKNDKVFFETLSGNSLIYLKMHKLIKNVCLLPVNQCIEKPFIIDKKIAHCSFNDFDINPKGELFTQNKHIFDCRKWQIIKKNRNLKLFSA